MIIKDHSNATYHAEREHLSSSRVKAYAKGSKFAQIPFAPTQAMKFGTAFHAIPEGSFDFEYHVGDRPDTRTLIGKAYQDIFSNGGKAKGKHKDKSLSDAMAIYEDSNGLEIVTEEEWQRLDLMRQSVESHPLVPNWRSMELEKSVYTKINGIKAKARPDVWEDRTVIWDWKTIRSIQSDDIAYLLQSTIKKLGYHASGWWYLNSTQSREFNLIFVESEAPHEVAVVRVTEDMINKGGEICKRGLDNFTHDPIGKGHSFPGLIYI